jgi:glucose-1-phosphate adenylyltransferase
MPLYTNARMLPPAKVTRTRVEHSILGEGSVIVDSEITDSVIGIRSFIGKGTRIHRTVMLGSDYYPGKIWRTASDQQGPARPGIGAGTRIECAIVDRNASIGRELRHHQQGGRLRGRGAGLLHPRRHRGDLKEFRDPGRDVI